VAAYLGVNSARSSSPEQVAMAVAEGAAFSLASHLYWAVWALTQARHSPIDFDYLGYSSLRRARFDDQKAAVRELVLQQFSLPMNDSGKRL